MGWWVLGTAATGGKMAVQDQKGFKLGCYGRSRKRMELGEEGRRWKKVD